MELAPDEILTFWFVEHGPADWFAGSKEFDAEIRSRFLPLCRTLLSSRADDHLGDPRTALAAVIVLDQFPRQVFRGTPDAFLGDPVAIAITQGAISRGYDSDLTPDEKQFLYMPLMHSEVLSDQELCVKLFHDLGNENSLKYAIEHRDIIATYGRFPHRNRILDRDSTSEELKFLSNHEGFGQ
ncbi:DUF924 family protein [Aquibium sp. LZ166]|uniref:DUF924 family protein n=1 Tax=Aquibium pacificus TaxID=3153579 RepID=A0ABV3SEG6_9HYPH